MSDFTPEFLACLQQTLPQECPYPHRWGDPRNFSNDPGDPGGKTMDGVIQAEYDRARHNLGLPLRDVRLCTEQEGEQIYWNSYWLPNCPGLPPGLNLAVFDPSVNEGPVEATRILQWALGIPQDGMFGPETRAHVQSHVVSHTVCDVIGRITARRAVVYHMSRGFTRFGKDWERRTSEIGAAALKMAEAT